MDDVTIYRSAVAAAMMGLMAAIAFAEPPASIFRDGDRVLFQGDSITDGGRGRSADPNHVLGHSYPFIIAARHGAAYPGRALTFINRGVSGNQLGDLAKRWQADTLDLQPDVISILIGINDVLLNFRNNKPVDVTVFEQAYDKLLLDTRAARPNVRLILLEPFIMPGPSTVTRQDEWVKVVGQLRESVAKLGDRHHVPVIHLQKLFDDASQRAPVVYWVWDGIHPTYAGHQLIADEWERVYAAFYGRPRATTRPS